MKPGPPPGRRSSQPLLRVEAGLLQRVQMSLERVAFALSRLRAPARGVKFGA